MPSISVQIEPPQISISSQAIAAPGLGALATEGKPIAAEFLTQNVQKFPDGSWINHSTSSTIYRDAQGRLRRESQLLVPGLPAGVAVKFITIVDPRQGCGWVLDPQKKVAQRYRLDGAAPSYVARLNAQGRGDQLIAPESNDDDSGANATALAGAETRRWQPQGFSAPIGLTQDVAGVSDPANSASSQPAPQGQPVQHGKRRRQFLVGSIPVRTENLGEQMILGYRAHGTRVITTVPAGQIGNDRPVEIVSEQWFSPDLQLVMRSLHRDPWGGEFTISVTKIRRGDQPAELFTVPAPYKVMDADTEQGSHILVNGRTSRTSSAGAR